jgi:hypothetical protein
MTHQQDLTVAFSLDCDTEEVWTGEHPENTNRPGTPSQGSYDATVGVPLQLDVLRQGAGSRLAHALAEMIA